MKMGITYRLFLLILCATGLAILFLILIMWWNINRGFYQYLGTVNQKALTQIADYLEKKYAQEGNWNFLKTTPLHWHIHEALSPFEPEIDRLPLPPPDKKPPWTFPPEPNGKRPPLPAPDSNGRNSSQPPTDSQIGRRMPPDPFVILNADHQLIHGSYPPDAKITFHPVVVRGNTVGYVGILSPKHFPHPIQLKFLSQQKLALILGALGMVSIIIIISFPLARRIVKPIREMAAATHDIASGKYTTRVSSSSTDELGQLARDFNAMALTLEKNEKERRQYVADISHELRTPVAVLQGEIEALLDGIRKVTPETVRSLHAETLRLKRLVEDLYQLSLSDLGALNYHKENLDIIETLRASLDSFRAEFDRKGIALKENIEKNLKATGFADKERLRQLFANLLENSLRYTDAGGILEIGAKISGNFIAIEFRDSKPGVPADALVRLFDRFYRVEESRSRTSGGAGIGLSISRKIVEAHEGTISAHPSPLGGLLIKIEIPVFGGRK